ncbi:hypothetical protein [Arcanobacterium phocae]|uniref:hypothetical protein n=1 Tax=Arcanobacterium phocae TaxID=131112 RepID=UPI001C0EC1F2|nr:hypothetical protein [Arcanobacterium phocae]
MTHSKQVDLSLLTDNGLLYPPELWWVLDVSTIARMSYAQLDDRGAQAWDLSPQQTIDAIRAETYDHSELEINYLVASALRDGMRMPDAELPFGMDTPTLSDHWSASPDSSTPIIDMLQIYTIAKVKGLALDFTDQHRASVVKAFYSNDLFQASYALELAQVFIPGEFTAEDLPTNFDVPSSTPLVLASLQRSGIEYQDLPDGLVQVATQNAYSSDATLVAIVHALQGWGKTEQADTLIEGYDKRRIISQTEILDETVFSGSEGSTYRVLRYEDETGQRLTTDSERAKVQATLEPNHSEDLSVRLAIIGSLHYLDPTVVTSQESSAVIKKLTDSLNYDSDGKFIRVEDAFMWMSVAETAQSLDTTILYPGLSEQAFELFENEEPVRTAPMTAKFILAINSAQDSPSKEDDMRRLSKILKERANEIDIAQASTFEIVYLQNAYQSVTGETLFPTDIIDKELTERAGKCRGGFKNMVRERRTPYSECSIETNRLIKRK